MLSVTVVTLPFFVVVQPVKTAAKPSPAVDLRNVRRVFSVMFVFLFRFTRV